MVIWDGSTHVCNTGPPSSGDNIPATTVNVENLRNHALAHWHRDTMATILWTTYSNRFLSMKKCVFIQISLKFVPSDQIKNKQALVQKMTRDWIHDKQLGQPWPNLIDAYMRRLASMCKSNMNKISKWWIHLHNSGHRSRYYRSGHIHINQAYLQHM